MPLDARFVSGTFAVLLGSAFFCSASSSQDRALATEHRPPIENAALDERRVAIAVAREKVLEILQGENSCSAWFRQADGDAASVFAGLRFVVDLNGPRYIIGFRTDDDEEFLRHPYAGSTPQNAGRGAVITLNGNGPFFKSSAAVMQQPYIGGALRLAGWRLLRVESYPGNSLAAQMTTLLHELGHVINRLPEDGGRDTGQSAHNTVVVLRFCRAQIKAAERADHVVVINFGN